VILLISAFQVARITGVSRQCPALSFCLLSFDFSCSCLMPVSHSGAGNITRVDVTLSFSR
jgi:hypothetical protein